MAHYDKIVERPGGGNPAQVEINPLNGVSVPYSSKSFVNDADATLPGTSDVGVSRPDFNADTFANFGEFNFTAAGESPIDWEHIDRKQAGCSVIDMNSIPDESGRTFHGYKEGKYFLPNDAAEQDRLDLQHAAIMLLLDGKLGEAPVKDPKFVLDIATGTGIWALDYAEQHPEAQVIGTDLSEIQPRWRMPNCSFVQDDCEDEWLFGSTDNPIKFDYVHLRWVLSCFDDPKKVMGHAYKNLQPGGWIEYCDSSVDFESVDDNIEGTALRRWGQLFVEGMALRGRDVRQPRHYAQWLREVGFVDVHEERRIFPCNPWPEDERLKLCATYMMTNCCDGFRGAGWKLFKHLGLSTDEIEKLVVDAKRDVCNKKYRCWLPMTIVYAQKPFAWEINPPLTFKDGNIRTEVAH